MTIREEFEKAFTEYLESVPYDERFFMASAEFGAKWMAERCAKEAEETPLDLADADYIAVRIRQLSKELE